ncbi:carbamoyl phosphate synthase small subunit [candidate division WOR-1 bacterium RIFCSPHIGHO2_01_FULL_53_15]|uniref:Carbamoyl phosphate synthase small chain n=1 Tax=candidate division WOR-1 bacterium RIFCSPHIGHO2_01_FULL_53_15 TaxID=1802564 RepID=A0A1F4Q329_UNCSA|nr:MAG: carbamoyl phosphate synthase small subunit [candidate division WOR-1 bacterium RIFCSPHIGHO2_01_FULL_53_15]OGC10508.1 MAG: carbamoyl phosphate synthase small subunit [candidate division WOR-1 bacterium RIFCSPHIGHO2_02_FULL_53_26]
MEAILALEDGTIFHGRSFGAPGEKAGEVVFNTSLTGYQEILTDPSYKGQIVTMTYPLIGNYGVNDADSESPGPNAEGFIVRENSRIASNFRSTGKLEAYLHKFGIVGIEGIDTRMLTRRLRLKGSLKGIISTVDLDEKSLVKKAKDSPGVEGVDLVKVVTCKEPYVWNETSYAQMTNEQCQLTNVSAPRQKCKYHVVAYDYGAKFFILRHLAGAGCKVTVVPADYPADKVLELNPDGIFLSNGPADPAAVTYAIKNIKKLIGKKPIFGICLGHQLLGLALGGKTYKLKFGHHGGNQPVMDLKTKKVAITAQNHGFAVDIDSIPKGTVELTHINLNDKTVEGMRHLKLPIFSVQYHPEAGPGPHDASYLFKEFTKLMGNA